MITLWSTLKIIKGGTYPCLSGKPTLVLFLLLTVLGCNLSIAQSGILDPSFDPGNGANDLVYTTSIQSDGKIIIGGRFSSYDGTTINRIARLNTDGSLDNSFDPGMGANFDINTTSIQTDGKIIIGGLFTTFDETAIYRLARLNADGSLDTSFVTGNGVNNRIRASSIQDDGKIIIGGRFISYDETAITRIARLNIDGSLDTSFNPGTGPDDEITSIAIQNDGKIIIGGIFATFGDVARNDIARLNADGTLDTSFDPGTGSNNMIFTTSIQSDGKIILGGNFTSFNGTPINRVARLNTDGSLDESFDPGAGLNHSVNTSFIQSDGKIILGGFFTSYDGTPRNHIARLNPNGSVDTSFDPGIGPDYYVLTISIQNDDKIIIGGDFTSIDGTARNRIARLNPLTTGIDEWGKEHGKVDLFPNPFGSTTTIKTEFELKNATLTIFSRSGQAVKQIPNVSGNTIVLSRDNLPSGMYFIRLLQDNQVLAAEKLIITD